NGLSCLEGFVAVHVDCGVVRKNIAATVVCQNETVTLGIIEPLYCAGPHSRYPLLYSFRICALMALRGGDARWRSNRERFYHFLINSQAASSSKPGSEVS